MKKLIALTIFSTLTLNSFAANLVVQQNGPVGTYASISEAVIAGSDGDIILVNNRIDGLPWIENVTINKSLTLLSAVDNVLFWVSGNYEIVRASNRQVSIVGMRNTATTNNLFVSGSIPAVRTRLKISQCEFSGTFYGASLENSTQIGGIRTSIYATKFNGFALFSFGEAFGNNFANTLIIQADPVTTGDTLFLVGNKMINQDYTDFRPLSISNTTQLLLISNNFIANVGTNTSSNSYPVYTNNLPKIGSRITNCYIRNNASLSAYAIFGWNQIIENSAIFGVIFGENQGLCFYNYTSDNIGNANGNTNGTAIPLNFSTLDYIENSNLINKGNPTNASLDLDLSRNNIGMFGGSYNINNFFPINTANSSVINMVQIPKIINQGQTLNLNAIATDK